MDYKFFVAIPCVLALGVVIGMQLPSGAVSEPEGKESQPLYWVAPMDPNFKRDKPGKSPMGMDLVPVYEQDSAPSDPPGTVTISPALENNLGVRIGSTKYRSLNQTMETVGYVQFNEDNLIHIHPRVEGWVEKLYVTASGNPVAEGEPLYSLYSPELVNAQEELLLALNRGNARLIQSSTERLRALQIPESFIQRFLDRREVMQTVTFYTPINGVVNVLNIREGFFVQPGTKIVSIANLDSVWVDAAVFERQSSNIAPGNNVTMSLDAFPKKRWLGKVDYVYPTLDEMTRTQRVRIRFDNPDHTLKPNMFARLVIEPEERNPVLTIPKESVIRTELANRVVLHLGNGKYKSVQVSLGQQDAQFVEIAEGLEEGDEVVISAQFLIDSESSRDSDLLRMQPMEEVGVVWTKALLESVNADMGMIKATHDPIPEWDWPVMTMMFPVADGVDLEAYEPGDAVEIQIEKIGETDWQVLDLKNVKKSVDDSQSSKGVDHD